MSIYFNGVDGSLDVGLDIPYLNNISQATIMVWVKPEVLPQLSKTIVAFTIGPPPGTSGTSRLSLESSNVSASPSPGTNGNDVAATVRRLDTDAGFNWSSVGNKFQAGVWTHCCAVIDWVTPANSVLYADGVAYSSYTVSPGWSAGNTEATNSKNARIAANEDNAGPYFWQGELHDARLYTRALSAAEVQEIAASKGKDSIINGLVWWCPMNDGPPDTTVSGTGVVKDRCDKKFHPTPGATPTWKSNESFNGRKA